MNFESIKITFLTKSINLHYANRYFKFIEWCSSKTRTSNEYLEAHHILPQAKTQFPEYKSFVDNPWNRIDLTGQEHFIAHWLIWKAQGKFMAYAFSAMRRKSKVQSNRYFKITGKTYEQLKSDVANTQSRRIITNETRQRMCDSQKNQEKLTCPHCHKIGNASNMRRWHFDNCKVVTGKLKHDNKANQTIVECPHCHKTGKLSGMYPNHFDNCSLIKDKTIKDRVVCPHCLTEMANTKDKISMHFDNCPTLTGISARPQSEKSKASNAHRGKPGVPKSKITCPYCGVCGTKKRMLLKHFDNCKSALINPFSS